MQNKEILKSTSKSYYFSRRLGVSLKPFDVPEIFLNLLKTLSMTVIPIILFSVGLNLKFLHIGKI